MGNSWEGTITDIHFQNIMNLALFSLSCAKNTSNFLNVAYDWTPPFDLGHVEIRDCQIGPTFPSWLQTQKEVVETFLTNIGISKAILDWFWNLFPQVYFIDLSHNKISGYLPKTLNFH